MKFVLSKGIDINTQSDRTLIIAAANGQLEILTVLVKKKLNVNTQDALALTYSVINNQLVCLKFLPKKVAQMYL